MYIPFVSRFKHADNIPSRLYSIPLHLAYILSCAPHFCRAPRVRFCAYTGTFSFILTKWRNCKWKNFYDCTWIIIIAARRRVERVEHEDKRNDVANVCIWLASRALKCLEALWLFEIYPGNCISSAFVDLWSIENEYRSESSIIYRSLISIFEINHVCPLFFRLKFAKRLLVQDKPDLSNARNQSIVMSRLIAIAQESQYSEFT
jgi:hypothetical protein